MLQVLNILDETKALCLKHLLAGQIKEQTHCQSQRSQMCRLLQQLDQPDHTSKT